MSVRIYTASISKYNVAVAAAASSVLAYTTMSLGTSGYLQWMGIALLSGQACITSVLHDFQASLVERDELGKLFACDAFLQAVWGVIATVGYNALYGCLVTWQPQFIFAASSLLFLLALITLCLLIILFQKHKVDRISASSHSCN